MSLSSSRMLSAVPARCQAPLGVAMWKLRRHALLTPIAAEAASGTLLLLGRHPTVTNAIRLYRPGVYQDARCPGSSATAWR